MPAGSAHPALGQRLQRSVLAVFLASACLVGLAELLGLLTYLAAFTDRLPPDLSSIVTGAAWARLALELALPFVVAGILYGLLTRLSGEVGAWARQARHALERLASGAADARVPEAPVLELHELAESANRLAARLRGPEAPPPELHDPLTGLPGRTLFMGLVEQALARAHRHGHQLALLVMDLDDFRLINESLGAEWGDRFLVTVADRLRGIIRRGDAIARTGGDEFSVLIEGLERPEDVGRIAERLLEQIAAPLQLGGEEVFFTVSIGAAVAADRREGVDALVRNAAIAMQQAKLGGKGRYEVYRRTSRGRGVKELRLRTDLRYAFERGEIGVRFQPVVDLQSREIREIAAGLHWDHLRRGPIPAHEFLSVAEESGLLDRFEDRLLHDAVREASGWWQEPLRARYRVSVALSGKRLARGSLIAEITRLLDDAGLPPEALKIELADGVLGAGEVTMATLHPLKHMGIELGLTQFGAGPAALDHLKRYSIDAVKLSPALVQRAAHDAEDLAILRMLVTIAKTLRLTVTADGIERADQVDVLRAAGCDRGQGAYFFRPLSARDLREALAGGTLRPAPGQFPVRFRD